MTQAILDGLTEALPASWGKPQLRRIARVINGGTPTSNEENWHGEVPFVTPPDLRRFLGGVVTSTERSLTEQGALSGSTVAMSGVAVSNRAPIGYVARLCGPAAFNQGCKVLVPRQFEERFLTYTLTAARPLLEELGQGTTFMELSGGDLSALRLPTPPLPEQRTIANYLDRETSQIDTLIQRQAMLIQRLRERRLASADERLHRLSGYPSVKLKYLFRPSTELNPGDEQVLSVYRDHGVIPKDSRSDNYNRTPENIDRYQFVEPGFLVVNKMKAWQGSLGVSEHRGVVSPDYEVLRPIAPDVIPAYVHVVLRSPKFAGLFRSRSVGIRPAQWRLYWDQLGQVEIPVPPRAEQIQMTRDAHETGQRIDEIIAKTERFIELTKERRSALITAAVTGQINVATRKGAA